MNEIINMIISFDEYLRINTDKIPFDYLSTCQNKRKLYCVGDFHSHDPNDDRIILIKKSLQDFVNNSKFNSICLLESNEIPDKYMQEEDSELILKYGERAIIAKVAKGLNLKINYLEKKAHEEISYLVKNFDRTAVEIMYILRTAVSINRKKNNIEESIHFAYESTKKELFNTNYLICVSETDVIKYISENIKHVELQKYLSPDSDSIFANMRRELSDWRNINLVTEIYNQIKIGNDVFVFFGASHIQQIYPALVEISKI